MRRPTFVVLAFLAWPSSIHAACEGQDYRNVLPAETMRELRASVEHAPFREGIAFEAVRGDTRVTLFGTVHTSHPAVFMPEAIEARIRASDLVLLESTSATEAELEQHLAANPSLIFNVEGPGLSARLSAQEWNTLRDGLALLGMKSESVDKMRPWFAALLLEMPPCEVAGQDAGGRSLDERIEAFAIDAGIGVEPLDELAQLIAFLADVPEDKQLQTLRLSLAAGRAADDDAVTTSIGVWLDEEPLVSWLVARERAVRETQEPEAVAAFFKDIHDYLVVERNRLWLKAILERTREARTIVVAVGALHLPGEQGLVRLLEAEGFAVRRLTVF